MKNERMQEQMTKAIAKAPVATQVPGKLVKDPHTISWLHSLKALQVKK